VRGRVDNGTFLIKLFAINDKTSDINSSSGKNAIGFNSKVAEKSREK
jgi:hypothetical protein